MSVERPAEHSIFTLDSSHSKAMRGIGLLLLTLTGITFLAWLMPTPGELKGIAGYLPLHTLLETIAIIISILIFAVGWNAHSRSVSRNIVLLSCVFFSVGWLDFSHVLSFKGMPDFVTPSDPEKAINFWLAARSVASVALLVVALTPWQPYRSALTRYLIMAGFILLTALIYWLFLFNAQVLPRTFIAGQGLTPFKVNAEYVLITLNLITALLFWGGMRHAQSYYVPALFGAACVMALSEFFFTLYGSVTDLYNLLGHIYKVIAYLLLYRAIFVETIDAPYKKLHTVQQNLALSVQASGIGLWAWEINNNSVTFSPEWKSQLGYTEDELANSLDTWKSLIHPDDLDRTLQVLENFLASGSTIYQNEFRLRHKDGTYHWIMARGDKEVDTNNQVVRLRGSHIDITERKNAEKEIHNLAFFDSLTRLPNRRSLLDRFNLALAYSARSKNYGAVMFLDLDHFKTINDTIGHNQGDLLLIEVANRLKNCVRKADTIARLGGDEFIVLIEEISANPQEASQKTAQIADKILAALSQPYQILEREHHSSASIGICLYNGNSIPVDDLLKHADLAMYQAKENGRNIARFFDPAMQLAVETHAALHADLRSAIAKQQLSLHYQIQTDHQQQPLGAEALLRWQHPMRGMVSPLQFIPIAEQSSLILEIGNWVLNTACEQLAAWSKHARSRNLVLAVNVSALQFKMHDFVDTVAATVHKYQINPALLKLELTESTILNDVADVVTKMHALKALGVKLSMDDFGTGYSSLSYLTRLPLDQLKIDQSFVRDIGIDHNDSVMVQTIIHMAKNFGLDVIAEGVETQEQLAFLKANGCLSYQGYLFGKPVAIQEFEKLLDRTT
jgi:diguanylate cyclase (GGDEF)-like protein/PAS domain S-box-containing protein